MVDVLCAKTVCEAHGPSGPWSARRTFGFVRRLMVLVWIPLCGQAKDVVEQSPHAMVEDATAALVTVINRGQTYFDDDPDRFYQEVASTLDPIIDFKGFSRSVMAIYSKRASSEQRERFAEKFKWGLVRTYGKALLMFENEEIRVLPPGGKERRRPDRDTVKMEVLGTSGAIYPVQYSMRLYDDGRWRLRNVIIEGINIGLVYRDQFAEAMKDRKNNGDIDLVIDNWSVVAVDAEKKGEEP